MPRDITTEDYYQIINTVGGRADFFYHLGDEEAVILIVELSKDLPPERLLGAWREVIKSTRARTYKALCGVEKPINLAQLLKLHAMYVAIAQHCLDEIAESAAPVEENPDDETEQQ